MEKRGAGITGRGDMVLMMRMAIEEGRSIDRGGTRKLMMAGVRNIAHGGQRTKTTEATDTAPVKRRTTKAVGVITTGPGAMLPRTKTITAGEKTTGQDGIVRNKSLAAVCMGSTRLEKRYMGLERFGHYLSLH